MHSGVVVVVIADVTIIIIIVVVVVVDVDVDVVSKRAYVCLGRKTLLRVPCLSLTRIFSNDHFHGSFFFTFGFIYTLCIVFTYATFRYVEKLVF